MSLIEKALNKSRLLGAKPVTTTTASIQSAPPPGVARAAPGRRVTLDMDQLRIRGMIPPANAQHRHVSQIRAIKNRLLRVAAASGNPRDRVIMFTSALSGDGKTFSSVNVALSLATERDVHVLLVDGDVPKPNVGQLFGIDSAPGFLDVARDPGLDPENLIIGTDLAGLDLMSAGRGGVDTAEIITSGRMSEVIDRLVAVPNRIVLLDSPPLLQTSEAAVLAQLAGQVVLVVREAATPQRAVQASLAMLGERPGVYLVLNGVSESKLEEYYYGYGQNHEYGQQEAEPIHERKVARG